MKQLLYPRLRHAMALAVCAMSFTLFAAGPAQAQQMMKPPAFLTTVPSQHGFDDTVSMLKRAIEGENLMVIHEINAQMMLKMVNVDTGGMIQLLFFHPRYMKRIMETNRNATIVPPLKVAIMEMPDGKVMVRYPKPSSLFEAYDGMGELGQEFDTLVQGIVSNVQN